uniref:Photosystem I reaction center subunit XII n=1 Tax=Prasinococcus sp. CCMP1194 TaxID=110672 RepID=A0A088CI59_9VIRI|nr:M polypeptide of photosystem I [Prasinococcus sp. CCMP1194]
MIPDSYIFALFFAAFSTGVLALRLGVELYK